MSMDLVGGKVLELLEENAAQVYMRRLERARRIAGAERIFDRISYATHREKLLDYLAEVNYALVFVSLGFEVEFEPFGTVGADLGITKGNQQVIVEVTRFRPVNPGPPEMAMSGEMNIEEYGNFQRDLRKAVRKIYRKFAQVKNQKSVIAIWNADRDLEEMEVKEAVRSLWHDDDLPDGLLFLLYGSALIAPAWVGPRGHQQLYCFPFRLITEPAYTSLQRELESYTLSQHIERALSS